MKILRSIIPLSLIIGLLLAQPAQAAAAAGSDQQPTTKYHLRCQEGACSLEADMTNASPISRLGATLSLTALKDRLPFLPSGTTVEVDDTVVLETPVGSVALPNAELTLVLDEQNNVQRLRGTTEVPFPTLGVLEDVQILGAPKADVGLELGEYLADLGLPLDPERQYLVFRFGTGLDVGAQVPTAEGVNHPLSLSLPSGQNAALVVDTEEPFVYLDGTVSVNTAGPMALVAEAVGAGDGLGLEDLPLSERATVHLAGLYPGNLDDAYVTVGGGYEVSAGMVGKVLGLEASPLTVEGLLMASPDGALLEGRVGSSLEPDTIFDGDVEIAAFIPFRGDAPEAYVRLDGQAHVPVASAEADLTARWSASESLQVDGVVTSPLSGEQRVTWTPSEGDPSTAGSRPSPLASVQGFIAPLADQGLILVRDASGQVQAWIVDTVGSSRTAVEGRLAELTD